MSIALGNVDTQTTCKNHRKFVSAGYHPYAEWHQTRRQPGGKFVSEVNIALMASQDGSFDDLNNIVPIMIIFSPQTMIL